MAETKLMSQAIKIPTGTTAQRPWADGATSGTSQGSLRQNTTTGYIEYWEAESKKWLGIGQFSASGGTESNDGTNQTHTYTSAGTFSVFAGSKTAVIDGLGAGGGGYSGQGQWAAGGGGGGFYRVTYSLTPGTYSIAVGTKGAGGTGCPANGAAGGTTSFGGSLYAYGGGGGRDNSNSGSGGGTSLTGQVSTLYNQSGQSGQNGFDGGGAGGNNGYRVAGLGNAYGGGMPGVGNYTPGIHANGRGNGGGGGPSCQNGHRGGGNGSDGILIVKYTP
jgi:hypothetical protein